MRIRTIKPEFWSSEGVASVCPEARLTFIGLWQLADDHGNGKANPKLVKAALFPLDGFTMDRVAGWVDELEQANLITRFEAEERVYYHVTNWEKHQAAAYRRGEPIHPAPPDVQPALPGVQESAGRELGREQGTGNREGKELHRAPRFSDFYGPYPRKTGRADAERAFAKAVKRVRAAGGDPQIIIEGALRYAADPNREPEFTKHPATWLNKGCWDDDPIPKRNGKVGRTDRAMEIAQRAQEGRST